MYVRANGDRCEETMKNAEARDKGIAAPAGRTTRRLFRLFTTGSPATGNRAGRVVPPWGLPVPARLTVLVFVFLAGPLAIVSGRLFAQQLPGEVLQEIERNRREQQLRQREERPAKPPVIIEEKKAAPKPAAPAEKVLVRKIRVEGNTLVGAAEISRIVAPYEGKDLSLEDLRKVAALITAKYREKGYIIANAFVPKQEVKDNIVTIKVVEGRVGSITVTGNKSYSTAFIRKYLSVIDKDPSPKEKTLERALILLDEYPSLDVKAALKAGKAPGTTDVIAVVKDRFPVWGSLFYDNYGTSATEKNRIGFGLGLGNLITSGDAVSLWGLTGADKLDVDGLSYGRVEYALPLGGYGTKAGVYYAHNLYQATGDFLPLGLKGNAEIMGVFVSHPLIKTRDSTFALRLGFDYKDVRQYELQDLTADDHVRAATFGLIYESTDSHLNRNFLNVTYHQGIRGFMGGNGSSDTDVSRAGADGGFQKVTADAVRIQQLPGDNRLLLRGSGQYSADPLLVVEQFLIGGAGSVRGFNPAQNAGDTGYALTAELDISPPCADSTIWGQRVGNTIRYALFVDHGYVRRNSPLPGDYQQAYLTGVGGGIRIFAGKSFSVKVDYAIPKVDSSFDARKSMTYVQAMITF